MELEAALNTSNETCYSFYESTNFRILSIVRASIGLVSSLACLGVIIIIFVFKKCRVFIQRLILYLAIAAMIHSLSYTTARVNYYTPRPLLDNYCYFGGLFNHYTAAVELISVWCIMISVIGIVLLHRSTHKLEVPYILATFLGPSLWFWVPVWLQTYGTAGGWCGIRSLNEDCSPYTQGTFIQFGIWYIPLYISLTLIFIGMIIVAVKTARDAYRWHGHFDLNKKQNREILRNEIKPLIWYPLLYLLLNLFSLISQIYQAVHPNDPSIVLTYLRVISSPLRGAFIALIYTLDKDTRRKLTPLHCQAFCHECCHGDKVKEYNVMTPGITDSYQDAQYVEYSNNSDHELHDSGTELIKK